jgi:hypothetical protein
MLPINHDQSSAKHKLNNKRLGVVYTRFKSAVCLASAIISVLIASGFWLASPVQGQINQANSPIHLTMSPSVVELAIQPGKTVTQAFSIKNQGTVDLEVTPTLQDFTSDNLQGLPKLLPSSSFPYANLANSNLKFEEAFILPAGASEQFVLSVEIPETAKEQDWYFSLLAKTKPSLTGTMLADFTGTTTQGTIGSNVLVRVTNTNQLPLNWSIELPLPKLIDSLQKIEFKPIVSNNSQTYAIPQLTITTLNWRRQIVTEQQGLPERILAQSQREIPASEPRKDDPRSQEGVPFKFNSRFALGKYTVRASIANNSGEPLVVEQQVWAFPFSIVGAVLGLIFILSLLKVIRQRRRQAQLD